MISKLSPCRFFLLWILCARVANHCEAITTVVIIYLSSYWYRNLMQPVARRLLLILLDFGWAGCCKSTFSLDRHVIYLNGCEQQCIKFHLPGSSLPSSTLTAVGIRTGLIRDVLVVFVLLNVYFFVLSHIFVLCRFDVLTIFFRSPCSNAIDWVQEALCRLFQQYFKHSLLLLPVSFFTDLWYLKFLSR